MTATGAESARTHPSVAVLAPAEEHGDAAPHDVEPRPLLAHQPRAPPGEGAPSLRRRPRPRRRRRRRRRWRRRPPAPRRRRLLPRQLPLVVERWRDTTDAQRERERERERDYSGGKKTM
ncbi:hypothetical protein EUGRSUZ_G02945 [Eucalyptus grandis]|uniref:Uncharacterized protein n=2 Tax=Eucalyptus grandis TaxID=71139 RepID=A0ACC3K7L9_EUCGR|nr:hypothetical protein EUGRSUZ_G02945 [Eucalyptus grandis]